MRCEVVLVRHAVPLLPEPDGPDDFHRGLSREGLAQARRLATELSQQKPAVVVSSPYLRAVQTVEPTARRLGLPVRTDPALREWDSGVRPRPDFAEQYAKSWADPTFARPGGESLAQVSERAVAALTALTRDHSGAVVVVGSHGTFVARALAGFGFAVDWACCRDMPMPAVYRLRLDGSGVQATGPGLRGSAH